MKNEGIFSKLINYFKHLFYDKIFPKFRPGNFKKIWDWSFVIFEKISYNFDVLSSSYIEWYNDIVDYEIKLAKISKKDHVLIIGCGSIPATSILVAMKTNSNIISVDIDKLAVDKAERYVKEKGLKDKIKFKHVTDLKYLQEDYDVIFILFGVKKPQELFEYLINNIDDKTRVIYRVATDKNGDITAKKKFLSKYFRINDFVLSNSWDRVYSFLLSKKR